MDLCSSYIKNTYAKRFLIYQAISYRWKNIYHAVLHHYQV